MVGGRSRGSPGKVLAVVLLMLTAAQTKGKSQLSIVEDINKSLDNILLDVQTLYEYIDPSTTSRETTTEGESTPGVTSETSSEFSVSTTGTTHVDSSSTDISSAPTDTATISFPASTASTTTTIPTLTTSTTTASSTTTTSTTTTIPTSTTSTTTTIPTSTTSTTTTIPTSTTSTTTTIPTSTTSTTTTIPTATTSTTTTIPPTTTTSTTTTIPTSTTSTTTTSPTTTTSTTTTTHPTTSITTSTDPTEPSGPESNDRVKRRNLLSLATLDDVLSAWVDPRSTWLEDKMSIETSDGTSNVTSDITRLETALTEAHEVVTQVAADTITEDQVTQMQAAEAVVKEVTDEPDEALQEKLQANPDYLDSLLEQIKKDQVTITATLDELKKRKTGIIVGSVLGGLVLVVLVVAGAVYYVRRKKKMNAGGRATSKKRSQSAGASSQQQMVELRTDHGMEDPYPPDEFRPQSKTPPNPLIPRANFDNFSLSSAQRNNPPESSRIPGRESPMQVDEMRIEPGIENPGYVEEQPPRPVVPPKPRNRPSTFDDFGVSPSQIRIGQEPSRADFVPSEQTHYIDELNYRLAPRERQVRPIGGNYHSPTEPSRRSRRDRSPRHYQHHHHHPRNHDHRMKHRNDHHVRRTPSMPPPDYTIPRGKHQSPDNFISSKPYSQKQRPPRSPYEFEAPQRPSAPPESEPPRPERNRSDIRRPYGPEDLY